MPSRQIPQNDNLNHLVLNNRSHTELGPFGNNIKYYYTEVANVVRLKKIYEKLEEIGPRNKIVSQSQTRVHKIP